MSPINYPNRPRKTPSIKKLYLNFPLFNLRSWKNYFSIDYLIVHSINHYSDIFTECSLTHSEIEFMSIPRRYEPVAEYLRVTRTLFSRDNPRIFCLSGRWGCKVSISSVAKSLLIRKRWTKAAIDKSNG